ncbi:Xaa-Pro peptidase family protein [Pseudogracilibacillus sp. SE30717A]|uniref:M24 family metallopeptidase n=1 Tax=Pseudogracilibacillus sp. SE30717A TaxID=3098293 RepID=UPI00300E4637
MYKSRQKQLMSYIQNELKVDGIILMSPNNIYYYTGFHAEPHERFFALFVHAETEKTILFLPTLDKDAGENFAVTDKIVSISDTENAFEKFSKTVGTSLSSFAIEKSVVTVQQYELLTALYPHAQFENIEPYIERKRIRKSPEEVEYVKKAIQITEKGLVNTLELIQPGMTELQIKAELEYQLMQLGPSGIAFDTIVLSGENSALPHGVPGSRKVQRGDFLLFDFGVTVNGYHSDLTRTFIVGEGSLEQMNIYETVCRANEKAIDTIEVGKPLKEIDLAAREYINAKHYGEYFTHRIGHGLGLDVHEQPSIHSGNETLIEPGMLFTVEPGIYVPEVGGVRIEDNVYINDEGEVIVLSSFRKALTYIAV